MKHYNIIAAAIVFTLVTSEEFRNRIIKHINACEEDDTYKPYIKFSDETIQETIAELDSSIKLDEIDEEFEMRFYQALQKGLEQFGIYTRADGDRLIVKQSIVEIC